MSAATRAVLLVAAVAGAGCGRSYEGGGELRAQKKVLEREVAGLRVGVERLERKQPLLAESDVAVAIDEALLQDVIAAQMPFENQIGHFHLTLDRAEVRFRGAPSVRLHGRLRREGGLGLEAVVNVIGALDEIAVDAARGALGARIVVDHIGIEKAAGIEALLSGSSLDEVARLIRLQLAPVLPEVQIPVQVQQSIELPAVTSGPVRLDGARMPIAASVSQVFAGQGRLWIAIHFEPGELVKTRDAPDVQDSSSKDVEMGFDALPPVKPEPKPGAPKPAREGQ